MEFSYARDVYGKTLLELGRKDSRIVALDADLSGSTRTCFFAREFPERFFNFGVAEQNMMAAAAGLASCGKIVFASTFVMFATERPLDQIRNTICYNNFDVKIVASHGGLTVGEDGSSHQALEDISLLRTIPNTKVIIPCDAPETRLAILAAYHNKGPFYIRLGRAKVPTIDGKKRFVFGKGYVVEKGDDLAIVACGIMVHESILANELLKKKGLSATIVNMHTIKPIDEELLIDLAKEYGKILVCEEHQITGGLYSSVCEVLGRRYPVHVGCVGVEDKFGQSGSPKELMDFYGLSSSFIAEKAQKLVRQQD